MSSLPPLLRGTLGLKGAVGSAEAGGAHGHGLSLSIKFHMCFWTGPSGHREESDGVSAIQEFKGPQRREIKPAYVSANFNSRVRQESPVQVSVYGFM